MKKDIIFNSQDYQKIKNHLSFTGYYVDIFTDKIKVWIEKKPNYFDRGSYMVGMESINIKTGDNIINQQDEFPRLYFDYDCMLIEISNFLEKRKQKEIIKIEYNNHDGTLYAV